MRLKTSDLARLYENQGHSRAEAVRLACGDGGAVVARAKVKPWAPYRSKTELAYASHLSVIQATGLYRKWDYEPEKWTLAKRCTLTPDFRVELFFGPVEYHEVKPLKSNGRFWATEDAWIKLKVAAAKYPERAIYVVWPADRRMTAWNKERVKSGEAAQ